MPLFERSDLYNKSNRAFSRELFVQYNPSGPLTLEREDKDGKISLYKLFVALTIEDPTEMHFAEEIFGDCMYWLKIRDDTFISGHLREWRLIAAQKRKEIAFKAILDVIKSKGPSSFTAAKYLIEEPWLTGNSVAHKKLLRKQSEDTSAKAYKDSSVSQDFIRLKEEGLIN